MQMCGLLSKKVIGKVIREEQIYDKCQIKLYNIIGKVYIGKRIALVKFIYLELILGQK